jgi:hypothetical protein
LADTRISNLASGGAVAANDLFVAVETPGVGPVTKTGSQLKNWAAVGASDPLNLGQYSGATDCTTQLQAALDYCFGPSSAPHSGPSGSILNKPFVLPPGQYNITAPLHLTSVMGGELHGAGRFATSIINTAGTDIFVTNGFEYSRISGMFLGSAGTTATLFNLDWTGGGGTALQSNTFSDMYFSGGSVGVGIGYSGNMGSENLFLNCFFSANADAGIYTGNFNALQNTILGGNFQSCGVGIWVAQGSVPNIVGTGFQVNGYDIQIDNNANDSYVINGSRTESTNFFKNNSDAVVTLLGCIQTSSANGYFINGTHRTTLEGCVSVNGKVKGNQFDRLQIRNCNFQRSDYLVEFAGSLLIDTSPQTYVHSGNYTVSYPDGFGAAHEMTSGSASNFTIQSAATMGFGALPIGTVLEVYQAGAGTVTVVAGSGVTLDGSTLTTSGQWKRLTIRQRAVDEWVVV